MIRNYFKIAVRKITRNKLYTAINVIGLTIGITCSCLLFLFVKDELSFDSMHKKADRIYRIIEIVSGNEDVRYYGQTSPAVGPALVKDYPQVINQSKIRRPWGHIDINWKGQRISERSWMMADEAFFQIFDFEFIEGSPETALNEPNQLVITEEIATKYFGNQKALGKVLEFNALEPLKISGVISNIPDNSHMRFDLLLSRNTSFTQWETYNQSWDDYGAYTYLLLDESNDIENVEAKIPGFIDMYLGENPRNRNFQFQPLTQVYLNSENIEFGISEIKGDYYHIYIFLAIGIFILLIACINYINLATAKSMQRAKEIGLRKVSGAYRGQLIRQFLFESLLITAIAFILSIGLIDLLLPYFNQVTDKTFAFSQSYLLQVLLLLFIVSVCIGLLSGSFPAFYLSKLKPTETLKGGLKTTGGDLKFRQILVITQFTLSIIMLIATIVVYQQMNYIKNKKLGFQQEKLLIVDINNGNVRRSFAAMKSELKKIPDVEAVAVSSRVPGEWKNIRQIFVRGDNWAQEDSLQTYFMGFDEDMLETYQIELLSGKNFSGNEATDSTYFLVNETAAALFGHNESLNEQIKVSGINYPFKIIGIIKDLHFQSLHKKIAPLIIGYRANSIHSIDYFTIKLNSNNLATTIKAISEIHEKFDDSTPMEYHFLDSQLNGFYQNEIKAGKLFAIGAGLTIFIACMGLFGLASFIIQRRTKEIGLRKVLGASSYSLLILLIKRFAIQVIISFLIATPLAFIIMKKWLAYFNYKIELHAGIFLLAGTITMLIAVLTICYRAMQAAATNPAQALKAE